MITYKKGNLLDVKSGIIAHGCNCQGVMGSGVALEIKNTYPKVFEAYKDTCTVYATPKHVLGLMQPVYINDNLLVINLFTQLNYGREKIKYISYDALDKSLSSLAFRWDNQFTEMQTLNIPKIGSGLGGGDWDVIESIFESRLQDKEIVVWEL